MFQRENINPKVQKALFNKINAMNRKRLEGINTKANFFDGSALEPQDSSNPIEQHLYRGTFAKVSVAVPEFKDKEKSDIIQKPISISSYISNTLNKENELDAISQKDAPLAFRQGFQEQEDNRFLGESGITSIKVSQQEYYTYKYTIGWICPDPVYFEEVFEPSFLQFGAYVAIEFGWGMNDSDFEKNLPSLSIEEMKRLLEVKGRLLKRNQDSAGNYYCGVGTVIKFDWKIMENGVYAGDIQVMTPGTNALLETTQGTSTSADVMPVRRLKNTIEAQRISDDTIQRLKKKKNLTSDEQKQLQELQQGLDNTEKTVRTLQENGIIFNLVIDKLEDVVDKFIEPAASSSTDFESPYELDTDKFDGETGIQTQMQYQYVNGALRISAKPDIKKEYKGSGNTVYTINKPNPDSVPDFLKDRRFLSYGWFEDNILRNFFEMTSGDENTILQTVKSVTSIDEDTEVPNYCQSSINLFSLGLDYTILPCQHNKILTEGFNLVKDETERSLIPDVYPPKARRDLARISNLYRVIDETFGKTNPFKTQTDDVKFQRGPKGEEIEQNSKGQYYYIEKDSGNAVIYYPVKTDVGIIRNMVFPIEKFKTHFANTPSLRQGLRNFWADVSNQYGGYWGFEIGQDVTFPSRVGVFDSYYADKKDNSLTNNPISTTEDPNHLFEFSVLSDKSIVKSFDVNLDISAEAATLARYGRFSKAGSGRGKIDGKKELGLEAWNILTSEEEQDELLTKEQLERFSNIRQDIVKNLQYPKVPEKELLGEEGFTSLNFISEDFNKIMEKLENSRTQFIKGVGCYDKKGNFSNYFKQTMLYLINYADIEGCQSNIEKSQPILPVSVSLTLDGIGGLKVGDLFKVDYLPELYRKYCYFMVSDIGHSVSTSGWETEITGLMIADMPAFWERSGKLKNPPPNNFLDLFTITNVEDVETARENLSIELFDGLEEGEEPLVKKAYDKVRNDIEEETAFFNGDYGKWRDFLFGGSQNVKRRSFNRIVNLYEEKLNNAWVEYRNFLTRFAASELKNRGADDYSKQRESAIKEHNLFIAKIDKFIADYESEQAERKKELEENLPDVQDLRGFGGRGY